MCRRNFLTKQLHALWHIPNCFPILALLPSVGIILKMAHSARTGASQGQKSIAKSVSQAPSKTLIIPAKELVQITAKVLLGFLFIFQLCLLHCGFHLVQIN